MNNCQLAQLVEANEHLVRAVLQAHAQRALDEKKIRDITRSAELDVLTNLPNRITLLDRVSHAIFNAKRGGDRLALLFIDLNKFKHINDTLGHAAGDQILQTAARCMTNSVRESDTVEGTGALGFYRDLVQQIETDAGMDAVLTHLVTLHDRITACPVMVVGAGVDDDGQALADLIQVPGMRTPAATPPATLPAHAMPAVPAMLGAAANVALVAPAQVNHCFASWPVPYLGHDDCAALSVLANLLTNQILHQALREEGGAYGGRAKNAPQSGIFSMYSYRDPRLADTYRDFQRAVAWVIDAPLEREHVEEAIIGVVSDLDKPQSPYDEALHAWRMRERGVTPEIRVAFRQGVLGCTEANLKAVARRYLSGVTPSRAAFASDTVTDLSGLARVDLHALAA